MTAGGDTKRRVHLRIRGRVQGVFYRESAKQKARALFLSGWVRNLRDGDVEALAEGAPEAVEQFLSWCRQGPPMAQVSEVQVEEAKALGDLSTFVVERTG